MAQTYLISNFDIGLERDLDPILIPERAFPELEDALVFRGRVERRKGFLNQGRLRRIIAATVLTQTTAAGAVTTIADLLNDASIAFRATEPNGEIQPATVTVTSGANVWNDATTPGVMTGAGGNAADGTINYATGAIVLNFSVADPGGIAISAAFTYYPTLPVMGLRMRELPASNNESTIAFDTKYAYHNTGTWVALPSGAATTWNGNNSQFFWTTNYRGANASQQMFWVTNFNQNVGGGDPIRYYNDFAGPASWVTFNPQIDQVPAPNTNILQQCRLLIPFKNRLLALNTWEGVSLAGATNFRQRCRFSQNGDPTDLVNGWLEVVIGRGGYIDAPTSEAIVSAQFLKDHLIVYFESSTWELVYVGNAALPFVWQQINTELGAESPFSQIPFDDGVLGVGNTGIHIANSNGVQRIDAKIPDEVGRIQNINQGLERVYGIRDYNKEAVYWTFPVFSSSRTYPNKVLVYNYKNNTFAIFNDRFTCYGYFQKTSGYTWATLPYRTWSAWTVPWNGGISQAQYQQIIAGNQQGFTSTFDDSLGNDPSLSIRAITAPGAGNRSTVTSPNHNLEAGDYITFQTFTGITITPIAPNTTQTFMVQEVVDTDNFTIDGTAAGTYPGSGGTITVLNNISIVTKDFDFFSSKGFKNRLKDIHFLFNNTGSGEVTLDVYQDFDHSTGIEPLMGSKIVYTRPEDGNNYEPNQDKIWHEVVRNVIGNAFQFKISLDDTQMRTSAIQNSNIVLHAILMKVEPTGRVG